MNAPMRYALVLVALVACKKAPPIEEAILGALPGSTR